MVELGKICIHYEFVNNEKANADLYIQQMHRLNKVIQQKQPDLPYGVLL